MTSQNEINMTSGKIFSKILLYAVPLMLSGILQLLYNAADIVVVGKFAGDEALAAVGATSTINSLFVNVFMGLSVGASAAAARSYGSKDIKSFSEIMHTSLLLGVIVGSFALILGEIFIHPILRLTNTPADVIHLSLLYMRILFIGMPAQMLYNYGAAILRSIGNTRTPLYILSFSGLLNISINLILVIAFNMDVAGVAIATIFSQYVSATLILVVLSRLENLPKFSPKKLTIHKKHIISILKIGVPAGINSSLFSFSNMLIQSAVNSYGSLVVAGNTVAANIEGFVYVSVESFEHTALTYTGQNFGAKNFDRIKKGIYTSSICATVVGLILGNCAYFFGDILSSIYTNNQAVIKYAVFRLSIISVSYFLNGTMHCLNGAMRGLGHSTRPMLINIFTICILRFLFVLYIFPLVKDAPGNLGLTLVYACWPVSWTLTIICQLILITYFFKKSKKENT